MCLYPVGICLLCLCFCILCTYTHTSTQSIWSCIYNNSSIGIRFNQHGKHLNSVLWPVPSLPGSPECFPRPGAHRCATNCCISMEGETKKKRWPTLGFAHQLEWFTRFLWSSLRLNLHGNIFHWIEIWHPPQKHTKLPNALSHPRIQAYPVPHLLHTTGFVTAASMPWRWCQKASWPPSEGQCPIRNIWWSDDQNCL